MEFATAAVVARRKSSNRLGSCPKSRVEPESSVPLDTKSCLEEFITVINALFVIQFWKSPWQKDAAKLQEDSISVLYN